MNEKKREIALSRSDYDAAIFDIMGVKGYDLLRIARQKGIFCAHGFIESNVGL